MGSRRRLTGRRVCFCEEVEVARLSVAERILRVGSRQDIIPTRKTTLFAALPPDFWHWRCTASDDCTAETPRPRFSWRDKPAFQQSVAIDATDQEKTLRIYFPHSLEFPQATWGSTKCDRVTTPLSCFRDLAREDDGRDLGFSSCVSATWNGGK